MYSRHFLSHFSDEFIGLLLADVSMHSVEHIVADVLQSNIEVVADILFLSHHFQQFPREVCWVGIMQSDPLHAFYVSHFLHEFGDMLFSVNIHPIVGQLLCNNLKLLHALFYEIFHLVEYFLNRSAFMSSRDNGDGAVCTVSITSLSYFQIRIVFGSSKMSVCPIRH